MNVIVSMGTFIFIAVLFIAQPWFSRKNVLFGVVFADDAVTRNKSAWLIKRRYLAEASGCAALLLFTDLLFFFMMKNETFLTSVYTFTIVALVFIETLLFILANRRTVRLKKTMQPDPGLSANKMIVELGKSDHETVLSVYWLFILLPIFLATVAVTVLGYRYMPDMIPTHFGIYGPDRWAPKSWTVVFTPVLLELALCTVILFIRRAPASVKGNPNAAPGYVRYRKMMSLLMLGFALLTELIFLLTVIRFLTPIPQLWLTIVLLANIGLIIALFIFYVRFARNRKGTGPILDDDTKWIFGLFYFNRSDPSIFIEKRVGIGYTINMARPSAWIILLALIVISIVAVWNH